MLCINSVNTAVQSTSSAIMLTWRMLICTTCTSSSILVLCVHGDAMRCSVVGCGTCYGVILNRWALYTVVLCTGIDALPATVKVSICSACVRACMRVFGIVLYCTE